MPQIKEDFICASVYNALPHIREASQFPEDEKSALEDLRSLLTKHQIPAGVSIRLIHKHFDAKDGEIMVFEKVDVPIGGTVKVMRPVKTQDAAKLRGLHYFVDDAGDLQAYEYGASEVVDVLRYESFLAEFCQVVTSLGLQCKFGLKLRALEDATKENDNWSEFEFTAKRSTIMIPKGLPVPQGHFDITLATEWNSNSAVNGFDSCSHGLSWCSHCSHCYHTDDDHNPGRRHSDMDFYLGGIKVEAGTPVHSIVETVTEICVN